MNLSLIEAFNIDLPVLTSVDWPALALAVGAILAMFRFKAGMLPVLGVCSVLGAAYVIGYSPPMCGADNAAQELGAQQQGVLSMLPTRPNERLVYSCAPHVRTGGAGSGE
jgi:hypothetical protein